MTNEPVIKYRPDECRNHSSGLSHTYQEGADVTNSITVSIGGTRSREESLLIDAADAHSFRKRCAHSVRMAATIHAAMRQSCHTDCRTMLLDLHPVTLGHSRFRTLAHYMELRADRHRPRSSTSLRYGVRKT